MPQNSQRSKWHLRCMLGKLRGIRGLILLLRGCLGSLVAFHRHGGWLSGVGLPGLGVGLPCLGVGLPRLGVGHLLKAEHLLHDRRSLGRGGVGLRGARRELGWLVCACLALRFCVGGQMH